MVVFQGFWHGPPLGHLRAACLQSFLDLGHQFQLYTYRKFNDIPLGVEVFDANTVIPESEILEFFNPNLSHRSDLGPFSDLFRVKLLCEKGGWWCDVDTICLSADIPEVEQAWSLEHPLLNPDEVSNGQVCLQRGSPMARELYRRCLEISRGPLAQRESMGPHLWTRTIADLGLVKNMNGNSELFYPLDWLEMFKLWLPEFRQEVEEKTGNSYFLPLYQSFPAYAGLSLSCLPPRGSYLHHFLLRYLGPDALSVAPGYTGVEVRQAYRAYFRSHPAALDDLRILCGDGAARKLRVRKPLPPLSLVVKRWVKSLLRSDEIEESYDASSNRVYGLILTAAAMLL